MGEPANVDTVAPLVVSTAVRSKTLDAARIVTGTVADDGATETAIVAGAVPGANVTVA
jgi:hypothetical protein